MNRLLLFSQLLLLLPLIAHAEIYYDSPDGLTLTDFTRLVGQQGVKTAYNLDGGDSSLLYFHGKRINEKPNQSIRKLQDVIYFVSAEGL